MDRTDSELIQQYFNGDEESLIILIHRHITAVYNVVLRLVGNNDADDVTQEVFVKAWRNLSKFKQGQKFRPWILTIARNSAIDQLRRHEALPFSAVDAEESFADTIPDDAPLLDEVLLSEETVAAVNAALETLSTQYREVVVLHDMEELTFEEIAVIVGRPMNTVKSQYRRAIALLRNRIAPN